MKVLIFSPMIVRCLYTPKMVNTGTSHNMRGTKGEFKIRVQTTGPFN